MPSEMSPRLLYVIYGFLLLVTGKTAAYNRETDICSMTQPKVQTIGIIGGVIELSSRVGKEQKIAMEMAVHDFHDHNSICSRLVLHLKDLHGNSGSAASAVKDFAEGKQLQAIIGTLTPHDTVLIYEFGEVCKDTPIVSLTPTAKSPPLVPQLPASFIQMSNDVTNHIQCITDIVSHFRWRKVTPIYEHSNSFVADSSLIIQLSESLRWVDSATEHPSSFPPLSSLVSPEAIIEEELQKLKLKNNRVFILIQSSLQFSLILFGKAKQMGMMGKGYVWVVSDDVANLLDSAGESVLSNMQGVIGFKIIFETSESFRQFKLRFRRRYRLEHPEEEYSNPSIYALRAYDAVWAIANAMHDSYGRNTSNHLLENILATDSKGLSGHISFNNGKLAESPTFNIINIIGKSYREIALWSSDFGFSENLVEEHVTRMRDGNHLIGEDSYIYWPGGVQTVPNGYTLAEKEKPLKIGVPARSACNLFVKVTYDQGRNETHVTGFTIDVFDAVVKKLPYDLPYVLVPYYGSYDEMVAEVYNRNLDAAVGDTDILADRYEYAQFSQPYMESGVVMVVKTKPDMTNDIFIFMRAFKTEMWILMAAVSISTGFVIWLTEHVENNPDFKGSLFKKFGEMLWFSITILSFAQRESIKSNLSRVVLATWLFVIVIVTACFTAILTSMMTVKRLQPSGQDISYFQRTNAAVGCNGNGFVLRYLVNTLHFNPKNIKRINSINDYPEAFKKGEIAAAFFIAPHSKVFLAEYCQGYAVAKEHFKLGGLGFVFPKGSPLAEDISEAILKITQNGELDQLERHMLSFSNCSSSDSVVSDDPSLGSGPFSGIIIISVSITALVLLITVVRIAERRWMTWSRIQSTLVSRRFGEWLALLLGQIYTSSQINTYDGHGTAKKSMSLELALQQSPCV